MNVLFKRSDDYHEIEAILHTIDLHDDVFLTRVEAGVDISGDRCTIDKYTEQFVQKTVNILRTECGLKGGIRVRIRKRVPVHAGLVGASSIAARVLQGLTLLYPLVLSKTDLLALAASIGSDVPFFLAGGCALARGRGELVEKLPSLPAVPVLLARPRIEVFTSWAYSHIGNSPMGQSSHIPHLIEAIRNADLPDIGQLMSNAFEGVLSQHVPLILQLKSLLLASGAFGAALSGTGPTVAALMPNAFAAARAARKLAGISRVDVMLTRML